MPCNGDGPDTPEVDDLIEQKEKKLEMKSQTPAPSSGHVITSHQHLTRELLFWNTSVIFFEKE